MRSPHCLWLLVLLLVFISTAIQNTVNAEDLDAEIEEEDTAFDAGAGYEEFNDEGDSNILSGDRETVEKEPKVASESPVIVPTVTYSKPLTDSLEFAETFDGDVFSRWVKSANEKFSGEWGHVVRETEAILGDKGLRVMNEAKHHGISAKLPKAMRANKGKSVALSYEVKFEDTLSCGGAYLKLFSTSSLPTKGSDLSEFDSETPYVVMFGPDRCGATNKVHFIIKQLNPISKEWVEHHLQDPPRIPHTGEQTHLFSFVVKPDNTYEVLVDNKVEKSGSMNSDFTPPFTPPKQIDDPSDSKPEDWVDLKRIPDPSAVKPKDWDEEAPRMIPDSQAVMPDGWLEDEPLMIPDPTATEPEDWNEEEDGAWSAPEVKNPGCSAAPGCGKWEPPMIPNPAYKGKWSAPIIDNPEYKGEWKARQIDNPAYFVSDNPHALSDFDAVGFELWTMQKGILFDNIVVARSWDPIKSFVEKTWKIRNEIEVAQGKANMAKRPAETEEMKMTEKLMARVLFFASEYPLIFGVGSASVILLLILSVIKMFKSTPKAEEEEKVDKKDEKEKKADKKGEKQTEVSSEESVEGESEGKEGELLKEKKGSEKAARQRRAKKD